MANYNWLFGYEVALEKIGFHNTEILNALKMAEDTEKHPVRRGIIGGLAGGAIGGVGSIGHSIHGVMKDPDLARSFQTVAAGKGSPLLTNIINSKAQGMRHSAGKAGLIGAGLGAALGAGSSLLS